MKKFQVIFTFLIIFILSFHIAFADTVTNTSTNWSGYVANGNSYTSITGTWTVPVITSPTTGLSADATWVGIGGKTTADLIQAGVYTIVQNGQVQYQAWYETLPQDSQPIPLTVTAGDSITATITQTSQNMWQITLKDATTGQSYQTTVSYASSQSSAEWIEEDPLINEALAPLDTFGSVTFSNAYAGTTSQSNLTIAQTGAQPITLLVNQNLALAVPSVLTPAGTSFSVSRTIASSSNTTTQQITSEQIPGQVKQFIRHGRGFGYGREVQWYYFRQQNYGNALIQVYNF